MVSRARSHSKQATAPSKSIDPYTAVTLVKNGFSTKQVASAGGAHQTAVQRWVRWDARGHSLLRKSGSGAIAKLLATDIEQMKAISSNPELRSASRAAKEISRSTGKSISKSIAWRALRSGGGRFWLTRMRPQLNHRQRQSRLDFSKLEVSRNWDAGMFTDSKYFQLHSHSRHRQSACDH